MKKYTPNKIQRIARKLLKITYLCKRGVIKHYQSDDSLKVLTREQVREIKSYYKATTGKDVSIRWHRLLYTKTGVFNKRYMPFEIYDEMITSQIPSNSVMSYFDDKALYRYFLRDFDIPYRIAECCNGVCYLPEQGIVEVPYEKVVERCMNITDCIIKPSKGSSAGIGVKLLNTENMPVEEVRKILNSYHGNFVVEKKIDECENLKCLNPTSCNSLRIHTYRSSVKQKVEFVSAYVRIGRNGKVIDNASSGGITCRILSDGTLSDYPCTVNPYCVVEKTDSGVTLAGYKIEGFQDMVDIALRAHSCLPLFGIIGWDICRDIEGKVVIIEFNPNPDMRIEQVTFRDTVLLDKQEEILKEIFEKQ